MPTWAGTARRALATVILAATLTPTISFAANPVQDLAINSMAHRHRDRFVPGELDRQRIERDDHTPELITGDVPALNLVIVRKSYKPLPRLVRVRFTGDAETGIRECRNGNVVLTVPKRLRGAQRRAAIRQAIRKQKLGAVASSTVVTAETRQRVSVVNDPA